MGSQISQLRTDSVRRTYIPGRYQYCITKSLIEIWLNFSISDFANQMNVRKQRYWMNIPKVNLIIWYSDPSRRVLLHSKNVRVFSKIPV